MKFALTKLVLIALALILAPYPATAVGLAHPTASVNTALFGREELFTLSSSDISALKSSGFTTIVLFVVDVESNGDLNYNGDHLIVQNGSYIGDAGWPSRLAALRQAPTTINRIEVCTGGAGAPSWTNIKNLIAVQGTGSDSILYRNFLALKNALGIDAICSDDEVEFDANSAGAFGNMMAGIGLKSTFCPYDNQAYWQSVKSQLGSNCDAVYLQCYDGGAGNDPADWNTLFGGLKVYPGDWFEHNAGTVQAKMTGWHNETGMPGGWAWQYEYFGNSNVASYASAINYAISDTGIIPNGQYKIAAATNGNLLDCYNNSAANGTPIDLWPSNGQSNQLWQVAYLNNGYYSITTSNGGRSLDCTGGGTDNGTVVELWDRNGGPGQLWLITLTQPGEYVVTTAGVKSDGTNDLLDGTNCSGASGTRISLGTWGGGSCQQQWTFIPVVTVPPAPTGLVATVSLP